MGKCLSIRNENVIDLDNIKNPILLQLFRGGSDKISFSALTFQSFPFIIKKKLFSSLEKIWISRKKTVKVKQCTQGREKKILEGEKKYVG